MATARAVVVLGAGSPATTDRLAEYLRSSFLVHTAYDGHEVEDSLDESVDVVLVGANLPELRLHDLYAQRRREDRYFQVGVRTDATETPQWVDATIDRDAERAELARVVRWLATRATYRRKLDTFYDLASRHASLDRESADPSALEARLDQLRTEIDETVAELDDESLFEVALDGYENDEQE